MARYKIDPLYAALDEDITRDPNELVRNRGLALTWPIRLISTVAEREQMQSALMVIINTPHIQQYLAQHDTKALDQYIAAAHAQEVV